MADKGEKLQQDALISPIFWLQGHIPNQKSLWELFTQDGTDQPHWLMDYKVKVRGERPRSQRSKDNLVVSGL